MFDAKQVKNQLVEWVREYFEENGKDAMAVVGISGGKDSSVVAALCSEALGRERVLGLLMPRGEQPDIDVALALVEHLGIAYKVINVGEAADALLGAIGTAWPSGNEQALVNTPARIRMAALYAASACVGGRVANTCNLSEDYVGYATKYGDGAGDFSPLSHLTVTEVKAVGRELGLPSKFVDKTPIDGLCGKTDEENLGFTYATLDRYIREGLCEDAAVREKIDRMHELNLHKLRLMPSFAFDPTSEA
ncbi:MAG: NAD(+) synthase [Clostridiales Family XIII bacterium]|jgi:NAD+ synthase|nr:NAD(+) synthase [Clostridiales Family XIII bacterium]